MDTGLRGVDTAVGAEDGAGGGCDGWAGIGLAEADESNASATGPVPGGAAGGVLFAIGTRPTVRPWTEEHAQTWSKVV
jgi:hypothetical protein